MIFWLNPRIVLDDPSKQFLQDKPAKLFHHYHLCGYFTTYLSLSCRVGTSIQPPPPGLINPPTNAHPRLALVCGGPALCPLRNRTAVVSYLAYGLYSTTI